MGQQLLAIGAVLPGAAVTYVTNALAEQRRLRHELHTHWDDRKLDAYATHIDRVRACVFLAVTLYEYRERLRDAETGESEIRAELAEAGRLSGRAVERIMLLGGDHVVEAAHAVNAAAREVDWQATGRLSGTLQERRDRNRAVFQKINALHETAREDVGVHGRLTGDHHPERDLLLPPARRDGDENSGVV